MANYGSAHLPQHLRRSRLAAEEGGENPIRFIALIVAFESAARLGYDPSLSSELVKGFMVFARDGDVWVTSKNPR